MNIECIKTRYLIPFFICVLLIALCRTVFSATLTVNDQSGNKGSRVDFEIFVGNAPNDVAALGFEIHYDPSVLSYRSHWKGSLISNFDFFDVNNASPGSVKVGGFTADAGKIVQSDSGVMVNLTFEVVGHDDSQVQITQLKDDIKAWSSQTAKFAGDHLTDELTEEDEDSESVVSDSDANEILFRTESITENNSDGTDLDYEEDQSTVAGRGINDFQRNRVYSNEPVEGSSDYNAGYNKELRSRATDILPVVKNDAGKSSDTGQFSLKKKAVRGRSGKALTIVGKGTTSEEAAGDQIRKNSSREYIPVSHPPAAGTGKIILGTISDKSLLNTSCVVDVSSADNWQALTRVMMCLLLTYYAALCFGSVLVGCLLWEFFKKCRAVRVALC